MTKTRGPLPDSDDPANGANAKADGTSETPEIKEFDLTSNDPVSFEVPPNTNLVVNVVGKQGGGCLSSFFSGCGCLATGFIVLALILAAIGSQTR